jgi:hypothetical protein
MQRDAGLPLAKVIGLFLTLILAAGLSPAHGQDSLRKYPKYLIVHFQDGRNGKRMLNNRHIKAKLKNDGEIVFGPFQVDSNFLYNATDTVIIDSIQRFQTYNPVIAVVGGIYLVSTLAAIVPAAVFVFYMLGSEPILWLLFLTPLVPPSLVMMSSRRRIKLVEDIRIEGRDKYPWHLSKEKAIINK